MHPMPTAPPVAAQDASSLLSLASDFLWETDERGRFTAISGPMVEQGNMNAGLLIGKTPSDWFELAGEPVADTIGPHLASRQPFRLQACPLPLSNGTLKLFALTGQPLKRAGTAAGFAGFQGLGIDLSQRLDAENHYRHLAYHDALTGLPNRRLLTDRLEQAIFQARRHGTRVAVILVDLDQFKLVNDRFGHPAGDSALMAISQRMRQAVRQSDTVARFGGDEFVVVLPQLVMAQDAALVAEKLLDAVMDTPLPWVEPLHLTASLGIALFPEHGRDGVSLLAEADRAMYRAKGEGGGRFR